MMLLLLIGFISDCEPNLYHERLNEIRTFCVRNDVPLSMEKRMLMHLNFVHYQKKEGHNTRGLDELSRATKKETVM